MPEAAVFANRTPVRLLLPLVRLSFGTLVLQESSTGEVQGCRAAVPANRAQVKNEVVPEYPAVARQLRAHRRGSPMIVAKSSFWSTLQLCENTDPQTGIAAVAKSDAFF
jgi:hypothetical protein